MSDAFDRLPPEARFGTSKLLSRNEVRRDLDGDREFIRRLTQVFGDPDLKDEFVLRHRATGLVITAYSAQSGPSYGGNATGGEPPREAVPLRHEKARLDQELDFWKFVGGAPLPADERARLHARRRELARQILEFSAPGFYGAAESLEDLITSTYRPPE